MAKWVVLMVALCQPVGASFLPDFCYKVHGFDERLKVVSKIPTFQRKLLGYSPTRAEVTFPQPAEQVSRGWPKTWGGGGVAPNGRTSRGGLGAAGMFFETKAACEWGRRHRQGALHPRRRWTTTTSPPTEPFLCVGYHLHIAW